MGVDASEVGLNAKRASLLPATLFLASGNVPTVDAKA